MISMSFVLAWKLQTKKNAIKASFLIGKRHQELNKGATRSHKRHQSSVLFPFQIFFFDLRIFLTLYLRSLVKKTRQKTMKYIYTMETIIKIDTVLDV